MNPSPSLERKGREEWVLRRTKKEVSCREELCLQNSEEGGVWCTQWQWENIEGITTAQQKHGGGMEEAIVQDQRRRGVVLSRGGHTRGEGRMPCSGGWRWLWEEFSTCREEAWEGGYVHREPASSGAYLRLYQR